MKVNIMKTYQIEKIHRVGVHVLLAILFCFVMLYLGGQSLGVLRRLLEQVLSSHTEHV